MLSSFGERQGAILKRTAVFVAAGLAVLMLSAETASSSENCGMMAGACRDTCGKNEKAEAGAFDDCAERQECCVPGAEQPLIKCCIRSFDAGSFGPLNCSPPAGGTCAIGSGSPLSCDTLAMCRGQK